MHLKLTRTGGFAGITPPPMEVDTSLLSIKDAQRVASLVDEAQFFDLPKTTQATKSEPDRFQYSLKIAHEDGRAHTITCDEEAASEPLRQLLQTLQNLSRK